LHHSPQKFPASFSTRRGAADPDIDPLFNRLPSDLDEADNYVTKFAVVITQLYERNK
jgi:hypothetical protein